ncbi:DUF1778 domain-containing protein [Proteus mirabilis]|nr:hypothetical protein AM403_03775 [Proteus mirabilis]RYH17474.1 DUF1778 domain-containing protein [Proteus mirabilis]RZA39988.1 DUF1778 domain-containing protein [Proteus mirabilis]TFV26088.1 DUF1778 domain-containing protein [Proteus mirabilis]
MRCWVFYCFIRAVGKNHTELVLKAVRRSAEETLTDLRVINVNSEVYQEFINPLDATLVSNETLRKTVMSKSP